MSPLAALAAAAAALALASAGCGGEDPVPVDPPRPSDDLEPGEVLEVAVRPSDAAVDLLTILPLKAHAVAHDGGRYDLPAEEVSFEVDDTAVAWVDADGRLVPLAVGAVAVTATWQEVRSEPSVVRVLTPGWVRVRTVDARTGLPLPAASVWLGDEAPLGPVFTGGDGEVEVQAAFGGPLTVTADFDGYRRTTVLGATSREVVVALSPDGQPPPPCTVGGQVRFAEEPGPGQMSLALSISTIPESPILGNLADFIGDLQDVEAFGLDTSLPLNMVVSGVVDHYELPAGSGPQRVVTLGGVLDVGVLLQLAADIQTVGLSAVFQVLGQHTADLRLGASEVLDLETGEYRDGVVVDAATPLSREVHVLLGPPPAGADFPDPATLLSLRRDPDSGYLVSGIGIGLNVYPQPDDDDSSGDDDATFPRPARAAGSGFEDIAVHEADPGQDGPFEGPTTRYLASVFEHGLGSGARASVVLSTQVSEDELTLPAFLGLPSPHPPTAEEQARSLLTWEADPSATLHVLTFASGGGWWDVVCDGEATSAVLPRGLPALSPEEGSTRYWLHESYGTVVASFDSLVNDADEGIEDLQALLERRADALVTWVEPAWP